MTPQRFTSSEVAYVLETALLRLRTLVDPTDDRCGCDGIAREEVNPYVSSWIIPHVEFAVRHLLGTLTDEEVRTAQAYWINETREVRSDRKTMYRCPFSKLRVIPTPVCKSSHDGAHMFRGDGARRCFYCAKRENSWPMELTGGAS